MSSASASASFDFLFSRATQGFAQDSAGRAVHFQLIGWALFSVIHSLGGKSERPSSIPLVRVFFARPRFTRQFRAQRFNG